MGQINWQEEVMKRRDDIIADTQKLLQIKSVLDDENPEADAPLGRGIKEALDFMLNLGQQDGFTPKNVDNLAGHLQFGEGEDILGILCHVDVVPEGDGWTSDPYAAEIRDGKIFARGAIDDKGPTMAAYYAMKIIKELGLPVNKRVRMIIGTDEESDWRCVDRYFEKEEMPTIGFAPDADFPIIYAEKGIADYDIIQVDGDEAEVENPQAELVFFQSGRRYNMVPDFAQASLFINFEPTEIVQKYADFLQDKGLAGNYYMENGELILELEGVSAHGMEPRNGKNAGLLMADFLAEIQLNGKAAAFIQFTHKYFANDTRGDHLGIAYSDDITGDLTINVGKLKYTKEEGGSLGLNMRYPVTTDMDATMRQLEHSVKAEHMSIVNFDDSKPHHVDKDEFLIQTLQKVYEEQTGEKAELLSIGGGTYARSLKAGVAFGALFPGREDVAHQKDEYMYIADLLNATAIYAQAIHELTK
ncbi:succinyl-diaminopimelate desuccinylase [Cytobacillus horneckiae]|uniref:Dipeptidase PepV n=1 Tax=Cytobacillus horneckiae TaxID=549687 RepID=A0A2N0ZNE8_9BACI|nr:dipeptidase PepV [Cytobacillus horneckiae]MBN6889371.1 dipeptidase PepV [Cytobacillus horneckiae]MCM3179500.1 dipeptidase PepV [Cytobacillus horneckiae]MEC1154925.1 dipeptidase PepV [Cytobacillus horneckiae]MED2936169.1 dipeptidase PepV [Cytobacillus horneckiae]PKG31039.1 dipeptidase PepV [Cytobacillus horneckiae]